jgi:hypothetical protein
LQSQVDFLQLMVNAHIADPEEQDALNDDEQIFKDSLGVWSRKGRTLHCVVTIDTYIYTYIYTYITYTYILYYKYIYGCDHHCREMTI